MYYQVKIGDYMYIKNPHIIKPHPLPGEIPIENRSPLTILCQTRNNVASAHVTFYTRPPGWQNVQLLETEDDPQALYDESALALISANENIHFDVDIEDACSDVAGPSISRSAGADPSPSPDLLAGIYEDERETSVPSTSTSTKVGVGFIQHTVAQIFFCL